MCCTPTRVRDARSTLGRSCETEESSTMTSSRLIEAGGQESSYACQSGTGRDSAAFSRRFVTPLLVISTLNPMNSSLIATALVPIAHALSVSIGRTAILVSVLYLASSIAQPAAGKLAEQLGPRRVLIAGSALVLLGGTIGGVGQDPGDTDCRAGPDRNRHLSRLSGGDGDHPPPRHLGGHEPTAGPSAWRPIYRRH